MKNRIKYTSFSDISNHTQNKFHESQTYKQIQKGGVSQDSISLHIERNTVSVEYSLTKINDQMYAYIIGCYISYHLTIKLLISN